MTEKPKSLRYYLRLGGFGLSALLVALAAVDLAIGWTLMALLISPPCIPPPEIPQQYEEYWLPTQDDLQIRSWYKPSKNGSAVIIMGGISGALGNRIPIAQPLIEAGFGVILIDTRACAQPKAKVTLGADEVYDAYAALDFLIEEESFSPEKIGIYGFSMGGVTAIRAAAARPEIHALVAEGGYADLGEHLLGSHLEASFLDGIIRPPLEWAYRSYTGIDPAIISPVDVISKISPRPVFLIYGEFEEANSHGMEQYAAALEPKQFWLVPGGSHGKNHNAAPGEYETRIINFFTTYLLRDQK